MAVETTTLVRFYEATVTQAVPAVRPGERRAVEIQFFARSSQEDEALGARLPQAKLGEQAGAADAPSATSAPSSSPVAATFVSFPWAPPGADEGWWSTPNAVARSLGLRPEHAPDYSQWPDAIPSFVARTLVDNTLAVEAPAEDVEADLTRILQESLARHDADLAAAKRFLAELLDQPVIPIEESPLSGASLAQLLGRAPEAAGAAVAAWGTAPDHTLLLLITMPTGMIVLGAAAGVAKALNTGLRAKILGWMGVRDPLLPAPASEPRAASEPSAASEAKDQAKRSLKRRLRDKLDEAGSAE